jgi:hypothetical protein
MAGSLERKQLCVGCISYLDFPVKKKPQDEMSKWFFGCEDVHGHGYQVEIQAKQINEATELLRIEPLPTTVTKKKKVMGRLSEHVKEI